VGAVSTQMQEALNAQLRSEQYSAQLYLAMSAWLETQDLSGFAHWMRVQAREEALHSQKFFDYVVERGGRVTIGALEAPPAEWAGPQAVMEAALEHEQGITTSIEALVALAVELRDPATESFLRWFVDEQVEEEATVDRLVKQLRMSAGAPAALFMLDRELAGRVDAQPPTAQ